MLAVGIGLLLALSLGCTSHIPSNGPGQLGKDSGALDQGGDSINPVDAATGDRDASLASDVAAGQVDAGPNTTLPEGPGAHAFNTQTGKLNVDYAAYFSKHDVAWYVSFRLGAVNTIAKDSLGFVRCVKGS